MNIPHYNLGKKSFPRIVPNTFSKKTTLLPKKNLGNSQPIKTEPVSDNSVTNDSELDSFDDEIMTEYYYFLANQDENAIFNEDYLHLAQDYESRLG